MIEIRHLALIRRNSAEIFAVDDVDEFSEAGFERFDHPLESGIVITAADLAPVVQEAVALHLQKFGLFLLTKCTRNISGRVTI